MEIKRIGLKKFIGKGKNKTRYIENPVDLVWYLQEQIQIKDKQITKLATKLEKLTPPDKKSTGKKTLKRK